MAFEMIGDTACVGDEMGTGLSMDRFPVSMLICPAVNYQLNFAIQYMKKGHKLVY